MSAADAFGPGFAEAEIANLALFDEPRHRADRLLDRHRRIDPVLVVEVDDIDAEPLEAGVAGLGDIGGAAVDAVGAPGLAGLAEFAGDHHAIAPPLQCSAAQLFVLAPAIHVRAVEMVDPEFERAMDEPGAVLVVAGAVDTGQ